MNDKEIAELRRRFKPDKNNITMLCGRYINQNHETISEFRTPFFLLPEEEIEKYLAIFRRSLSGVNGKNLIDVAFSMNQVESGEEHALLMKLRDTALKDEESVKAFFDKATEGVMTDGNSLILLLTDTYDVPTRHRDDSESTDSDSIFRYIACAVCPVKEGKATLSYDASDKNFKSRSCEWNVAMPEMGFLFPAFDDRKTNLYNALYYARSADDSHTEFSDLIFKAELPLPANEQKVIFEGVLSETLKEECSYEVVEAIRMDIAAKIEEHKASRVPEVLTISEKDVKNILSSLDVSEEKTEAFSKRFAEEYGAGADLPPRNLIEPRKLEVKTPEVQIKVSPDRGDLLGTRVIDGVKYLLVRADEEITFNGIPIRITEEKEN